MYDVNTEYSARAPRAFSKASRQCMWRRTRQAGRDLLQCVIGVDAIATACGDVYRVSEAGVRVFPVRVARRIV